jgi:hypothetical protein
MKEVVTPRNNPTHNLSSQPIPWYQDGKMLNFINQLNQIKMVTVTACLERQKKDGTMFTLLELSGGAELILSQTTQRYYATVRKCTIPFTGTMDVAKMLIGQKIEGEIVKVIVAPYDFINQRTGEVMKLQHSYAYRPKDSQDLVGHTRVQELSMA